MTTLRALFARYLVFELIFTFAIALHLGVEGLAREFCEWVPLERCDEVEWSGEPPSSRMRAP